MGYRKYSRDDIAALTSYCSQGKSLAEIADAMSRGQAGIVSELHKLAKRYKWYLPHARRYVNEYRSGMKQRPLKQADVDALINYLAGHPEASYNGLNKAGFREILSRYPGGTRQARRDVESRRLREESGAYSAGLLEDRAVYSQFLDTVASEQEGRARSCVQSRPELRFVTALSDEPTFNEPLFDFGFAGALARKYAAENPPAGDLERYKSGMSSHISAHVSEGIQRLLGDGELAGIIYEMLEWLGSKPYGSRQRMIIEMRYIADMQYKLPEIGVIFGAERQNIDQSRDSALKRLRRPKNSRRLRAYLERKRREMARYFHSIGAYTEESVEALWKTAGDMEAEISRLNEKIHELEYPPEPPSQPELLSQPKPSLKGQGIESLNLIVRTYNVLKRGGVYEIPALTSMTEDELLKLKNFGHISLREVRQRLADCGLKLREE